MPTPRPLLTVLSRRCTTNPSIPTSIRRNSTNPPPKTPPSLLARTLGEFNTRTATLSRPSYPSHKAPSHSSISMEGTKSWAELVRSSGGGSSNSEGAYDFGSASDDFYHLHIYSHRHNTHVTFTDPSKNPLVSLSCGNIGFKKAQRSTYDAAYQLAAHVFKKLEEKNVRPKSLEVVLRGFGAGRDAVMKALLGQEGIALKGAIRRVTDSTRLKFGGTRSKKPRRLG